MTVDFSSLNHLSLTKVETTPGTDASPTSAANALRTMGQVPDWGADLDLADPGFHQESISAGDPIIGGGLASVRGVSPLSGAGTAGTAPDFGPMLQAAAMQETLTAADITGTSQAIAAGTITLAAGASATDNLYVGMVLKGTSGSCNGQFRVIAAYNGTTKVASIYPNWSGAQSGTPTYSILANARYVPVTQGQKNITYYGYKHGLAASSNSKLRKLLGASANIQLAWQTAKIASLSWTLQGQISGSPTDVSKPAAAVLSTAKPKPFLGATCVLNSVAIRQNSFSFDFGNQFTMPDDPTAVYGKDIPFIGSRKMAGSLRLAMTYISTQDVVADFIAGNKRPYWAFWGTTGLAVSVYIPNAQYTGPRETDIDRYAGYDLPFQATGSDSEIYIGIL